MKLRTLDLFAGIGGIALGLERTGLFETAAFCEIDPKAQTVLRKNWPTVPIFDDVSTLTKEDLPDIDVITGGFPCQDISLAGKGGGLAAERSGLWFEFLRLIDEVRPKAALIENVSALRNRGLDEVLRGLASVGYDAEWHAIPASAVGAPHRRDRLWIIAYPADAGSEQLRIEPRRSSGQGWAYSPQSSEHGAAQSVADTDVLHGRPRKSQVGANRHDRPEARFSSRALADTDCARLSLAGTAGEKSSTNGCPRTAPHGACWWTTEPDVGRVAHGVPGRVDRLKQLGNAVVPQVVEALGPALYEAAIGG